jgi:outer membrane lipoprotein-sorting protein
MSATRAWDRAASLPVPASGAAIPEVVALREELPSLQELFTFMRDAELRFRTLRMRIEEHAFTARGEDVVTVEVTLEHPGRAKVLSSLGAGDVAATDYDVWLTDGETVQTYTASRRLGTRRPVRPRPRGLSDRDLPGASKVYEPVTALQSESLPDVFIHPAGYCQNVLGTGACRIAGTTTVAGREAIVVECDHPRSVEMMADRPDFAIRIAVDRQDGVILRLEESIAGRVTRDAIVASYTPDAPLPPSAFAFTFPSGTTFIY